MTEETGMALRHATAFTGDMAHDLALIDRVIAV